ncbi:O-antigen ligase family protein [Costertonia aggregata]|uniref:O-antigen ligase family protein n=1 Tax=Costertonia aggregata TaxID=343403 RepID=UPI0037431EA6
MILLSKKKHIMLLFLFITFLVMNAITYNINIFLIGKYGKLATAILGIISCQKSIFQFINFAKRHSLILIFWFFCMCFTFYTVLDKGLNIQLIQNNILFVVFIYFFYLLSLEFRKKYFRPHIHFFKYLVIAMNANFVFWTFISVVFSFEIWHTLEDRSGLGLFYENYLQLGIFSCVAAIANLFLVMKRVRNREFYLVLYFLYLLLVILSNSRNSQFILLIFTLLSLFPYLKNLAINYLYIILFLLLGGFFMFFTSEYLLAEDISGFTTGRSVIWYYIYEYYTQTSIFLGHGIFGLNTTILENNISYNYYFQRLEFLYFHSSYIEVFCASGLVGFFFFCAYLVKFLKRKKQYFLVIIIISVLLGGLFESFLVQPTIMISFLFWYFMVSIEERRYRVVSTKSKPLIGI